MSQVQLESLGASASVVAGLVSPPHATDAWLRLYAATPENMMFGEIERDQDGAALGGGVVWPDGVAGTYTATEISGDFPGKTDAYTVTYLGTVTKIITQDPVTRNLSGAIIDRPFLSVV